MAKKITSKKTAATTSRPTRSSTIPPSPPPSDSVLPPTEVTTADDANEQDPGDKKGKRKAWSSYEESKLCIAWISVSQDPEKGSDQNREKYWNRIYEFYETARVANKVVPTPHREQTALEQRFGKIKKDCLLFCGYYEKIEKAPKSGTNEIDWVSCVY